MATNSSIVDVPALIDKRGFGGYQIWIFVVSFLIALMDGLDSQTIGVTAPLIVADLRLSPAALGAIFSVGQWGSMLGMFLIAPFADRWGRKWFLVASGLLFAVFTFLTALADSFTSLLMCRLLIGVGIGVAAPCFMALATEYAPRSRRPRLVTIMWAAIPGGGMLSALIALYILPLYGWRSFYYLVGTISILVSLLVLFQLPESLNFMVTRGSDASRIRRILYRITRIELPPTASQFTLNEVRQSGVPVKHLFTRGRAISTTLLWIAFFINYLVIIAMVIWMPILLKQTGMSISEASLALASNNIGGVIGCLIIGYLIERWGIYTVLITAFGSGAFCLGAMGFAAPQFWAVATLSGLAGLLIGGGGGGVVALAAIIYPTFMRSTGLGWGLGVSRFGGALGPLVAATLAAAGWGAGGIFLVLGLILLCAVVVVALLRLDETRRADSNASAAESSVLASDVAPS